jgi:small subunit ribosomal protein S5
MKPPVSTDRGADRKSPDQKSSEYKDYVVRVNRTAKVVKGGRRFGFSALVVIGNQNGKLGLGFGKANEVPQAVQKAIQQAQKSIIAIARAGNTIPHQVLGHCGASKILLMPAPAGTGVIAGAAVRAVLEAAGIKDIFTKAHGSTNAVNLTKAAVAGLRFLKTKEELMALRGMELK